MPAVTNIRTTIDTLRDTASSWRRPREHKAFKSVGQRTREERFGLLTDLFDVLSGGDPAGLAAAYVEHYRAAPKKLRGKPGADAAAVRRRANAEAIVAAVSKGQDAMLRSVAKYFTAESRASSEGRLVRRALLELVAAGEYSYLDLVKAGFNVCPRLFKKVKEEGRKFVPKKRSGLTKDRVAQIHGVFEEFAVFSSEFANDAGAVAGDPLHRTMTESAHFIAGEVRLSFAAFASFRRFVVFCRHFSASSK